MICLKRVLLITVSNLVRGGVQKFLEEWIDASGENYQYTLYCGGKNLDNSLKKSFEDAGVKVVNGNLDFKKNTKYYYFHRDLKEQLSFQHYDIVHINTSLITFAYIAIRVAKKSCVKTIIMHSHGSSDGKWNGVEKRICSYLQRYIRRNATKLAACSIKAAEWMFGYSDDTTISWEYIQNKIDISQYQFDQKTREKCRREIEVAEDCLVLGTVGRMNIVKNQMYLLEIMKELKQSHKNIKLIIIGTGALEEEIRKKIISEQLEKQVFLLGERRNVNQWLQAMDVFLMPSLHEGFPIAAIEAQAAGLPCMFADNFSREVKIGEYVEFLPLNNLSLWTKSIIQIYNRDRVYEYRDGAAEHVRKKGFDKSTFSVEIASLYN